MKSNLTAWYLLPARVLLFLLVQAVFALGFFIAGSQQAWNDGANWWLLTVAIADLFCLFIMLRVFRNEGRSYWDMLKIHRSTIKVDLLAMLGLVVLVAPVSYFPNVLLGKALFGSSEATLNLIVRPLPTLAVYAVMIVFPIIQGLTEGPTYFGYIMPKLKEYGVNKWVALVLPALFLSFQHVAAPLLFDIRFIAWRGLMFLPFALLTGLAFHWRPRLLPYFVVIHILMNMSFAAMFLEMAY